MDDDLRSQLGELSTVISLVRPVAGDMGTRVRHHWKSAATEHKWLQREPTLQELSQEALSELPPLGSDDLRAGNEATEDCEDEESGEEDAASGDQGNEEGDEEGDEEGGEEGAKEVNEDGHKDGDDTVELARPETPPLVNLSSAALAARDELSNGTPEASAAGSSWGGDGSCYTGSSWSSWGGGTYRSQSSWGGSSWGSTVVSEGGTRSRVHTARSWKAREERARVRLRSASGRNEGDPETPRLAPEHMSYAQLLVASGPLTSARDDWQRQQQELRAGEQRRQVSGRRRKGTRRDRYLKANNKSTNVRSTVRQLSEGLAVDNGGVDEQRQRRPRTAGSSGAARAPLPRTNNGMAVNPEKIAYYKGTIKIGLDQEVPFHKWHSTANGIVMRPNRDAFVPREAATAAALRRNVEAREERRQRQRRAPPVQQLASVSSPVVRADVLLRQLLKAGEPGTKKNHMDGVLTKLPISTDDAAAARVSAATATGVWDNAVKGICRERAQDKEWNRHRNQVATAVAHAILVLGPCSDIACSSRLSHSLFSAWFRAFLHCSLLVATVHGFRRGLS